MTHDIPENLTLNDYQDRAMQTRMETCRNIPYMLFNLQGEVGELSSKIAKLIRHGSLYFETASARGAILRNVTRLAPAVTAKERDAQFHAISLELGDVLWQVAGLASALGYDLDTIARDNLAKLASRQQRHVIDGDGDNR